MNSTIKSIFLFVANKLGLQLEPVTKQQVNDFYDTETISITASLAERIAKSTMVGSKMIVEGTSARATAMQEIAEDFYLNYLRKAITFALGTGSALIKPSTDGKRFGFDIIAQENYCILEAVGGFIKAIDINIDQYTENNHTYYLNEIEQLQKDLDDTPYLSITYMAFKDDKQVPLEETRWKNYTDKIIPNMDKLMFGRIVCPSINRDNVNSKYGVSISFGLKEVVDYIKDNYRQYNQERTDKETMIFADKNLFVQDENGTHLPKGKNRIIQLIKNFNRDKSGAMIDTYSPEIRESALDNCMERNLRMFEMLAGLGEGVLSKSTATYTNVDQVRDLKEATYSFMVAIRTSVDDCVSNLFYALNILMNYNVNTLAGNYDLHIEWSDQYMSSVTQRFAQYMQAETAGWIEPAEGRAMLLNEDIDEAREAIKAIKQAEPKRMDDVFMGGGKK